jgi:hypothetical protein
MTFSQQLTWLRYTLSQEYQRHRHPAPALHPLLTIPLPQRLVILAKLDAGNEREIRQALQLKADDPRLSDEQIVRAVSAYQRAIRNGTSWPSQLVRPDLTPDVDLTNGEYSPALGVILWDERYGRQVERTLQQLVWADVAVALIGEGVTKRVAALSLRDRLILYCLAVEGCSWKQTQEAMRAREFDVRRALRRAMRVMEAV